jgi:hypothetical protein
MQEPFRGAWRAGISSQPPSPLVAPHTAIAPLGVQETVSLSLFNQRAALEHFSFSIVLWVAVV